VMGLPFLGFVRLIRIPDYKIGEGHLVSDSAG
jgi:hypothetical protein